MALSKAIENRRLVYQRLRGKKEFDVYIGMVNNSLHGSDEYGDKY